MQVFADLAVFGGNAIFSVHWIATTFSDCPNLVFPRFQSELAITVYKVSIATPLVQLTGKKMKHIILSDQLSGARSEHVIQRSPAP